MKFLEYLMLAVFFVSAGIHLYASLKQDKLLRNRTKPFILVGLLGFYLCAADPIVLTVVFALFFSWLGDVLLIPKGIKWFTAGGIAFMVSHVFFILSYAKETDFAKIPTVLTVILPAAFAAAVLIIFKKLRPHLPKALFYPMLLYLLLNRAMTVGGAAGLVTAVGALLFFVSDCTLFFVRFHKESRVKTHFPVMLTYSLGEFLIILGLIMR